MKALYLEGENASIGDFSAPIWKGIESVLESDLLVKKPGHGSSSYIYEKESEAPDNFDFMTESFPRNEDGFCFTVSLHDATTLHVTSRITMILGYPKDMLKGQCILNYLYPRDRLTFASHLSQGLQSRFAAQETKNEDKIVFYVRMREYKALSGGFSVAERKAVYRPFQLTCLVKDIILGKQDNPKPANGEISTICLVASASPILPAHKVPNEKNPAMTPFSSRHNSACHFSHMDTSSIPYLGYLPQDITGYSVFDFYHQDDLHLIRDIYELVVREEGASFRSKPYRFRVFNGDYITLETDWSSFINPWSRRMEFVIGHHRIVDGPSNPNIFSECEQKPGSLGSTENHAGKQHIQEEVRNMLSKPIKHHYGKSKVNRRKRNLAAFVSNIIDGIEVASVSGQECSCSDAESVVMGAISPHQEGDSDPSPETPASFQQMRLQDNIERFFASQPKTNCAPSSSSGHSNSTTQNNSSYGSGSNDDSVNLQQTCNSMDSGINGTSSNSFETPANHNNNGSVNTATNNNTGTNGAGNNNSSVGANGNRGKKKTTLIDGDLSRNANPKNNSKKTKYPEHWNSGSAGSPINSNCVSLTEEVLSHHNKMTSKRLTKQQSVTAGCTKGPKKTEQSKFKRAFSSGESILHTKPKQACFHNETPRRKCGLNGVNSHANNGTGPNFSEIKFPLGIPVLVNQPFTELHRSLNTGGKINSSLFDGNSKSNNSTAAPHILMPVMYFASPLAVYPGQGELLGQKFYNTQTCKRNVKLQTDLGDLFGVNNRTKSGSRLACPSNLKKTDTTAGYKTFNSIDTSQSGQSSNEYSVGTFSLSEETSNPSEWNSGAARGQGDGGSGPGPGASGAGGGTEQRSKTNSGKEASPRLESGNTSSDSNFRYQVPMSGLEFTLKKDLALLENMEQPCAVKRQLRALSEELLLASENHEVEIKNGESFQKLIGFNIMEDQVTEEISHHEENLLNTIGAHDCCI